MQATTTGSTPARAAIRITWEVELLDCAWLRELFDCHNPYVDPLNLLQVQLLNEWGFTDLEELTFRKTVKCIFYSDIYGPRPMERELHNVDVWRQCGFESPPSRRTLSRFIADFELVAEDVFINLVYELAERYLLGKLFRIDGTDIPVDHRDEDAELNYDHTENGEVRQRVVGLVPTSERGFA